jgi:hypothetical protein
MNRTFESKADEERKFLFYTKNKCIHLHWVKVLKKKMESDAPSAFLSSPKINLKISGLEKDLNINKVKF